MGVVASSNPISRQGYFSVAATILVGVLASVAVFLTVSTFHYRLADEDFRNRARDQLHIINNDLGDASDLLYTLSAFMEAGDDPVSRSEFIAFSHRLHQSIAGLRDATWAPRVAGEDRADFERRMRAKGLAGFRILELSDHKLVTAQQRSEYFPMLYSEGDPEAKGLIGLDLAFEPMRRATIRRSFLSGRPSATPPIMIYSAKRRISGLLSYLAVGGAAWEQGQPADSAPRGLVMGAFEIAAMIDNIVAQKASLSGLDVYFFEPGAKADARPNYARVDGQGAEGGPSLAQLRQQMQWHGIMWIMDQPWTAIFMPTHALRRIAWDWQASTALGVGAAITAMISAFMLMSLRKNAQLQSVTDSLQEKSEVLHRKSQEVAFLARHDTLTGLPNRALFRERLELAMADARRGQAFCLLCMDLDRFKAVNDTLGHGAGDQLLCMVAGRMSECLRDNDTVARLGGDEFTAILHNTGSGEQAALVARRLIEVVSSPYQIDGNAVSIGMSIGISIAPPDGRTADELAKHADLALYAAKDAGRGTFCLFDPRLNSELETRRLLEADMRRGLGGGEFVLHYQPIVSIEHEYVVGFEALARWNHPERGLLPPGEFIAFAEERGLIATLGRWALRQACADAGCWPTPLYVAVNVSPTQLRREDLQDDIRQALAASGLPPHRLEIEITEAAVLGASSATIAALSTLRDLGVQVAFDDFGTGFSSLSSLHRYPIDRIKVDRTFVLDLGVKPSATAIVRAIVGLGSSLGLATTGEGIETREQLAALRALGCSHGQGYLFSPPRPAGDLPGLLRRLGSVPPARIEAGAKDRTQPRGSLPMPRSVATRSTQDATPG